MVGFFICDQLSQCVSSAACCERMASHGATLVLHCLLCGVARGLPYIESVKPNFGGFVSRLLDFGEFGAPDSASVQEVSNNWYPGEVITDPKYGGSIAADDLAATAKQALYEYYPIPDDEPLYGKVSYGKHLDVFLADMRSYRCVCPHYSACGVLPLLSVLYELCQTQISNLASRCPPLPVGDA